MATAIPYLIRFGVSAAVGIASYATYQAVDRAFYKMTTKPAK